MRLLVFFVIGLLLIIAGIQGNPGSMIGALLDPGDMLDLVSTGPGFSSNVSVQTGPPLGGL